MEDKEINTMRDHFNQSLGEQEYDFSCLIMLYQSSCMLIMTY